MIASGSMLESIDSLSETAEFTELICGLIKNEMIIKKVKLNLIEDFIILFFEKHLIKIMLTLSKIGFYN